MSSAAVVVHHLALFGLPTYSASAPLVLYRPALADDGLARRTLATGRPVVALLPREDFASTFDITIVPGADASDGSVLLAAADAEEKYWSRLRTLHRVCTFTANLEAPLHPVVRTDDGAIAWGWRSLGKAGILFIGTDLSADLVRYRQGDPAAAANRQSETVWGIAGERPNYLYDSQLAGEVSTERHADWWCETLAQALVRHGGASREPMLPGGAVGAIVITGDDDQASLETYNRQRALLGSLPVTYFLHPLTKHTSTTLAELANGRRVELGIHPDALDEPQRYAELYAEQTEWFKRLTGTAAQTVRNHGFLNDGYWGHVKTWQAHGVTASSNLPGFDGRMMNGSLLPARLALDGVLTDHWSILTAIGDGIVFIHEWDDVQSAACIYRLAQDIRNSGIPGVIVLNLHPQNVEKTVGMHRAVCDIAAAGFVAWTLSECIDWFATRSAAVEDRQRAGDTNSAGRAQSLPAAFRTKVNRFMGRQ